MRICRVLLIVFLLCVVSLTYSASIRAPGSDTVRCHQKCSIDRRKIMAAARRYCEAKYEKRVMLLRQQIHRLKLVRRRLREIINYNQRNRIRYQSLKHAKTLRPHHVVNQVVPNHHREGRKMFGPRGTQKVRSQKRRSRRIHLRAHTSIKQKLKRVVRVHDGLIREMYRTLTFRRRIFRVRQSQRIISARVGKIIARRRAMTRKIAEIQLQRRRLRVQLKEAAHSNKMRGKTLRITHQINSYTRHLKRLKFRQVNLRKRSARLFARLHRLSRRIAVLQKRVKRQLSEGRKLFVRKMRLLLRWNILGPKRLTKLLSAKSRKGSTSNINNTKDLESTQTEPNSRADILRIIKEIDNIETEFRNASEKLMHSNNRVTRISKWIARLKQKRTKLSTKAKDVKGKNSQRLRHRISKLLNRERHLLAKEAEEQKINTRLSNNVQNIALAWLKSVVKHRLQGFVKSLGYGVRNSLKFKKRIFRRKQRRQQRATRRQRLHGARWVISRGQRKRFAKRVERRVRRFKKRLAYESRKATIINQRKLHILRRRIRLRRRDHRIKTRNQRLKRQIVDVEKKCKKLLHRMKQLKLRKMSILDHKKRNGNRISLRRINNRINLTAHKVKLCLSRTVKPRKRIVKLKIRVRKIAKKRLHLRRRIAGVRRRVQRQAKRVQRLVKKKQRFVRRAVRKKLIRRKVIRHIEVQRGGYFASGRRSMKRVVRSRSGSHKLGNNPDTQKNRSHKLQSGRIHIRARKPIKKEVNRANRVHDGLARQVHRTFTFRRRIYRIRQNQRIISGRIGKTLARSRALTKRIADIQLQRRRQRMQLKHAPRSNKRMRDMTMRLTHKITSYTRHIESLKKRQVMLKKRTARLLARMNRLSRRIVVLRDRETRQLRESSERFNRLLRMLVRTNVYGPKRWMQVLILEKRKRVATKIQNNMNSKVGINKSSVSLKPNSRAEIRRIVRQFSAIEIRLRVVTGRLIQYQRRVLQIQKRIAELQKAKAKLSGQASTMKGNESLSLRHRIAIISTRQRHLEAKIRNVKQMTIQPSRELQAAIMDWRRFMKKHKLQVFMQSTRGGLPEIIKMKKRILRRKQRRQQRAIRQQKLHVTGKGAQRVISHAQRKRITKRIIKRVTHLNKRLKSESRKAKIIDQRKQHIIRRRIRLRRRAHRISSRGQRLKRRIVAIETKRKKLTKRVTHLKLKKRSIYGHLKSKGKGFSRKVRHIDNRIKRTAHKVALCTTRTATLKKRRVQLKIRVRKIAKKRLRLRRRIAGVQRRIQRQTKRVQRLVTTKRRFVRRVVRKKLIRRKVIRHIAVQRGGHSTSRIMKQGRSLGTYHDGHVISTSSAVSTVVPEESSTSTTINPAGSSELRTETSETQVIHGGSQP